MGTSARLHGVDNPNSKFSEEQVCMIWELHLDPENNVSGGRAGCRTLCRLMNLPISYRGAIENVIQQRTYRELIPDCVLEENSKQYASKIEVVNKQVSKPRVKLDSNSIGFKIQTILDEVVRESVSKKKIVLKGKVIAVQRALHELFEAIDGL